MASQEPFGNDPSKIERYRAFWNREDVERPLVGFSFKSWFPLEEYAASAAWQSVDYLTPDMVDPEAFMDDQERLLREGETVDDDILRGASPSQAVSWLVGMLGNRLRILPGSILGEERTIVAGLGQAFSPDDLVGKQAVVVANLKPAKLMGVTSEGMLLAATDKEGLALVTLDRRVEPGSKIS